MPENVETEHHTTTIGKHAGRTPHHTTKIGKHAGKNNTKARRQRSKKYCAQ
jgi:hypothetical protein